ncbi:CBS domain-containing protein [Modicisalibacter xianhensis]|uniref:CBS domain-containing protein n=1 Tax=Modicisalibacter xianhensis TaxID=442341 RepID=A0A1I3D6U1_9GAMM|nr:CBS domain-containing protein [Halomonas xianhensis]TDX23823.1 CBS domain-containing protein [Halomonas xianhensis]SFH82299.1 CBS domain-containing protein [Halomonas xianhensis]
MQVKDVMTKRPDYLSVDATIREVAERMSRDSSGFEPLVQGDKIACTITDRDIAVRAVAEGKSPDDKASSIATKDVLYTYEDEDVVNVLKNMQEQHVQRLIVLNNPNDKDLAGVVTVGDIADRCDDDNLAREIVNCSKHYH